MAEGLPEVPGDVRDAAGLRRFLTAMRNIVAQLQEAKTTPDICTNVVLTPVGGAILIQFTRPVDCDGVTLFASAKPDISAAVPISLSGSYYRHELGGAVAQWYWLVAFRANVNGLKAGPFTATSLAAGAGAVIPTAPPSTDIGPSNIRGGRYGTYQS